MDHKKENIQDEILIQVWKEKDHLSEYYGNDLEKYFLEAKDRESKATVPIINREQKKG